MYENEYMYAIERDPEYLAHYGIKGMKWGVRKAIERGNQRALGRQYRKAQKKLAKLEKRAANGAKYARRAARLGAGAAAAGGLAVAGTAGVGRLANAVGSGMRTAGYGTSRLAGKYVKNGKIRRALQVGGQAVGAAGGAVVGTQSKINRWGNATNRQATAAIRKAGESLNEKSINAILGASGAPSVRKNIQYSLGQHGNRLANKMSTAKVSNNTLARIGAGAVGAGLAGAAGYNAYRAATTKRAAKKAAQFRSEMNKAFKGTQYANGGNRQGKKRRRRG